MDKGIYNGLEIKINWQRPEIDEAGITYLEDNRYKGGMNVVKLSEIEIVEPILVSMSLAPSPGVGAQNLLW